MSSGQGLTSLPGFYKGAINSSNNVYVRKGEDIIVDDLTATNITVTDGTNDGIINILNGDLTFQCDNEIVFDPNGTGQASLTIGAGALAGDLVVGSSNILQLSANNRIDIAPVGLGSNGALSVTSNLTSVTLASRTAGTQAFYCRSTPAMTVRNVGATSAGVGVDSTFLGNTQVVTITDAAGSFTFTFGTGSNPLPAGGVYDFVLAPASITGGIMRFVISPSTQVYQVTATNGTAKWVRIFCDGNTIYPLVLS